MSRLRPTRSSRRCLAVPILAAAACLAAWTVPAVAVDLLPHRAVYDVELAAARGSRSISSVDGRMEFQWTDVCQGWAIDYRARLRVVSGEGAASDLSWSYSAWESDDSLEFRFFLRRFRDGHEISNVRGNARLDPGDGGEATLMMPDERSIVLPPGTLFPNAHTRAVIAAAQADRQIILAPVFDGTGDDSGLFAVNAIILGDAGEPPPAAAGTLLDDVRAWRIQLAFFPPQSRDGVPESEQRLRLYENGVAGDLQIDYGDIVIDATLRELDAIESPECR